MKKSLIFLSIIFLIVQFQNVGAQKMRPDPKPKILSAREIANKVLPSVVLIITQDENGNPIAQGSGFVYKPGLVVSNLHVFERATNASVKNVTTGEVSKALEVVGMNAQEDICVIRIDNARFPALSLGDSKSTRMGDEIYVASNPKGLEGSFTRGIVSSVREKNRVKDINDEILRAAGLMTDRTLFQIDAAISPGSSGGVLVNTKAQAIGIVKSSVVSGQNLNFAIPIEQLRAVPLIFSHSIQLAGACAYRDRSRENLRGLVKTVIAMEERSIQSRVRHQINSSITFDMDGNISERVFYDASTGSPAWKESYEYDERRILRSFKVRELFNGLDAGPSKETLLSLADGIGRKLLKRQFSQTRIVQGLTFTFDSSGKLTKEQFPDGTVSECVFDDHGNEIECIQSKAGRLKIRKRYRYKFDQLGNWVERIEENNFPNSLNVDPSEWLTGITEYREITYYE